MTPEFECKVKRSEIYEIRGDEVVKVPGLELHYTHNGYQWTVARMTYDEWDQAIAAITADREQETT